MNLTEIPLRFQWNFVQNPTGISLGYGWDLCYPGGISLKSQWNPIGKFGWDLITVGFHRDLTYIIVKSQWDFNQIFQWNHTKGRITIPRPNKLINMNIPRSVCISCWTILSPGSSVGSTQKPSCKNSRAPVAQSVLTRAVNPGIASSNPSLAIILSDDWQKSMRQASFVFHQWANSLCGKAASCLESMLCGVLVWEKPGNIMSRWTGWRDMTEIFLKTALKPNINQSTSFGE